MDVTLRKAADGDLEPLVELMRRYYAHDGHAFDADRARSAMKALLEAPGLGRVWVLEDGGTAIGYLALTLGYSLEIGGRDAFIDELFLQEEYRGRGHGTRILEAVIAEAEELGVQAVHLEVTRGNEAAALYARLGFEARPHRLMTRRLLR